MIGAWRCGDEAERQRVPLIELDLMQGVGSSDGPGDVTSSVSSIDGAPRSLHYASSKGALNALTRGLAVELARHNITANTIIPGWIETGMTENTFANPRFEANVLKRIPFRRWGQPEDFGGLAVYLMSDASAYHSGDEFVIDGAYTKF